MEAKRLRKNARGIFSELRTERRAKKITLKEMSRRTGLSVQTVWRVEVGLSMRLPNILLYKQALEQK